MDALRSLIQPLVGGTAGSSVVDGMKLVVLGGTVETARRVSSSAWSHFVNSFFLTAHFCEEDLPYDWLMLWLSRRPEWQRSREFETTTRTTGPGSSNTHSEEDADWDQWEAALNAPPTGEGHGWGGEDDLEGRPKTKVIFQPTYDTTHTIYYRGHWLRVRRGRKQETGSEMISISVVARNNAILKQLVLQAKKEYEAEAVHRIQIYFADAHGSWRWTDSRHKRPMASIVLNPGVKEMLLDDARDFLRSEKWYADRGIPFRRGYLLHGVPGSGKSSLIHALAGQLQLDIYVVSLSASWISDNTLTALMGRVPARCVLLLEDLDAAFVRTTNREDDFSGDNQGHEGNNGASGGGNGGGGDSCAFPGLGLGGGRGLGRRRYGRSDGLSDMNTLSLSGLLNALDGVAASEGRLLFATTNHLERLDPALSRPGRMDVWVEFKNASKWQAEALFRNFFPCDEDEEEADMESLSNTSDAGTDLGSIGQDIESKISSRTFVPNSSNGSSTPSSSSNEKEPPVSVPSLWSLSTSISSSVSGTTSPTLSSPSGSTSPPLPRTFSGSPIPTTPLTPSAGHARRASRHVAAAVVVMDKDQFGASNTAYLPPPPDEALAKNRVKPLDKKTLAVLAKRFADGLPDDEFSVAGLQGYLLKHKAQPEAAANGVEAWVKGEREMRERLKKEKEARELREKTMREKRRKEAMEKEKARKAQDKKDQELERVKALLAEKEKEDELEKMRQQLKQKEEEKKKKKKEKKGGKKEVKKEEEKKDDDDDDEDDDEDSEEKKDDDEDSSGGLKDTTDSKSRSSPEADETQSSSNESSWDDVS